MKYTLESAVAIVTRDDKLLTMHRLDHDKHVELPGGKIRPDETPDQAIVRELKEELGVTARSLGEVALIDVALPERRATVHVMRTVIDEGNPRCLEDAVHCDVDYRYPRQLRYEQRNGLYTFSPVLSRVMTLITNGEVRLEEEPIAAEG